MSKITNKSTWAILLSIVAILMCLLAFGLWIFEVIPHSVVMPETFIGVCVALMGVIVTVAVGWQIYNAIEIKSIIREYAQKQAEVERLQMQLKTEISRIKIDSEYDVHHSLHLHAITLALHCEMKKKYAETCYHCIEALAEGVQMRELMNVDNIIDMIHTNVLAVTTPISLSEVDKRELKEMEYIIRESKYYHLFADKYEKVLVEYYKRTV